MAGLYLGIMCYWVLGILKPGYWHAATLVNILFMGGLALGRTVSLLIDGFSIPFTKGLVLELLFMSWGIFNLKKYSTTT